MNTGGDTPPDGESKQRALPEWLTKLVFPIVIGVVVAIALAVLTPVGDWLRELAFPTEVNVSGTVTVNGEPVAEAQLILDDEPAGTTTEHGTFVLKDVGKGDHTVEVSSTRPPAEGEHNFSVPKRSGDIALEEVVLDPSLRLGYALTLSTTLVGIPYDVTLWMIGDSEVLDGIQAVTYQLPDPLTGSVSREDRASAFCYREVGKLAIGDATIGNAVASALVQPRQGEPFQITAVTPGGDLPPQCPKTVGKGGSTGGGSTGGGSTGGGSTGGGGQANTTLVPDIVDLPFDQASALLRGIGLKVSRTDVESEKAPGTVISQTPGGGERVALGTTVALRVSKAASTATAPDVTNETVAEAQATLAASGFDSKVVAQETDDANMVGIVISQDPVGGSKVALDTVIALFVGELSPSPTTGTAP